MLVLQNMDELMEMELDPPKMEGKGKKSLCCGACLCLQPAQKAALSQKLVSRCVSLDCIAGNFRGNIRLISRDKGSGELRIHKPT